MVVCQYYLRGQCKFGDNCRNEHPRQGGGTFSNATWFNNNNRNNDKQMIPFSIDSITKDLSVGVDKPAWPLSSYGPAKNEPTLLGGLDETPEELRVRAVMTLRAGNANEYMTYEASKISAAEAVYNNARTNIQQAFETAAKQSPYSHLYTATSSTSSSSSTFNKPSPFASSSSSTTSAFGGTNSTFGQPAFGQTGFGTMPTSAFGQSSTTGPTTTTTTTTGAFGQPITQPTPLFGGSAFGQTSQPLIKPGTGAFSNFGSGGGGFSAFAGQPSPFGATSSAAPAAAGGAVLGQPPFGTTSAFGALAQQQQQPAPSGFGTFGQPPPGGATTIQPTSASTAPTAPGSAFGQPAQPFGVAGTQPQTPSAFSAFSTTTTSVFGQPPQQRSGHFGTINTLSSGSAFTSSPFSSTTKEKKAHSGPPNFGAVIELGMQCLNSGMGRNTTAYRPGSCPYDTILAPTYMEIMPKNSLEVFKSNKFEWGNVPECVPPIELR